MQKESFLKYLKYQKKYSSHTVDSYANDIKQFYIFCIDNEYITTDKEIPDNFKTIRKWIAFLSESGISARTINRKLSTLKTFFKYLVRQGVILNNPTEKLLRPKAVKTLPGFINKDKFELLLDSSIFGDDFKGVRDRLIIELLYGTGIRRSELINLKISNVSISSKTIKVFGKRNKERIIPFPDTLVNTFSIYLNLKNQIPSECDNLFITEKGLKLYPKLVYLTVKKYLNFSTTQTKLSPHIIRHSYATHILNNGADINAVKELLGHSNLSATQIYTHNTFEKINKIYKQAHPRAQK